MFSTNKDALQHSSLTDTSALLPARQPRRQSREDLVREGWLRLEAPGPDKVSFLCFLFLILNKAADWCLLGSC